MSTHSLQNTSRQSRWATAATVLVIVAVAAAILGTLDGRTIGLFHDDGLYAVAAQSLAKGNGYRIASLPGQPYQTKYPPLYSAVLSVVWYLFPSFPANILWLKATNVLFVVLGLAGAALWSRLVIFPFARVLFVALIGTCPGVVTFSDYTMSDIAFLSLVVWYSFLWCHWSERRTVNIAIILVTVAAVLTRSVGIALIVVTAVECIVRRRWRWLPAHVGIPLVVFIAWSAWAAWHRSAAGELLAYYLQYETSALGYLRSDPGLARDIVVGNIALTIATIGIPLGPWWQIWQPLYILFSAVGVWALVQKGQRVPLEFAAIYVAIVLLHPFSPHRYLLVIAPLLLLAVLAGAERLAESVTTSPTRLRVLRGAIVACLAIGLLAPNVWLILTRNFVPSENVRGWYWRDMEYQWSGFEETFEWIRRSTPGDAKLATMFDPTYFLFTGRQGVRPWLHNPQTYFYPVNRERVFVGDPKVVLDGLRSLGVGYVILDPPAGYAEGEAGMTMLRELLRLPEVGGELLFRSTDGRHEIYRIAGARRTYPSSSAVVRPQ